MKITIAVLAVALAGCFSMGQQKIADEAVVAKIEKGKSTKADVQQLLGLPAAVDWTPDGTMEKWVYMYTQSSVRATSFIPVVGLFAGGSDSETNTLSIFFRKDGIVEMIGRGRMVGGGGGLQDVGQNPQPLPQDAPARKENQNQAR